MLNLFFLSKKGVTCYIILTKNTERYSITVATKCVAILPETGTVWGKYVVSKRISQNIVSLSVLPEGNQDRWQYIVLTLNNKIENQTKIDKLKYPMTCLPRPPATLLWRERQMTRHTLDICDSLGPWNKRPGANPSTIP
jgi:hypothetical protein